ncbi:hypothetical protein C0Q70_15651 [Pomacea canaliculata]|uniref:Major facilitator superfamily (MFS) profile domain-containing protein n=1 Tax=Pomacea canaliculata TaxID=400727 RepID=A0A2T7NVG1_POMCA|nr:hypothetical protein C0Q70_15651 [Pomacea canaliculata]
MWIHVDCGFASMTVPVYVAEAAPPDIRGRLVTLNQLFITIGILISSIIAGAFHEVPEGWRYMLGLAAIPGVIQFIGFMFLPESPRWLISKGRTEDARKVLQRIRDSDNIDDELKEVAEAESSSQTGFVLGEVLRTPHVRKALFIGSGLQLFQQLCGINTVIYYSASILKLAGFPSGQAIWLVCVPNVVNFLSTFIGVWAVERFGRKLLLVVSFLGVVLALVVLAVGFQLSAIHSPPVNVTLSSMGYNDSCATLYDVCENCILNKDCGYCYDKSDLPSATCAHAIEDNEENALYGGCSKNTTATRSDLKWALGYCPTDYNWMAVIGLALFVFSFAPGLGPMPWTINSEIYPMWARGTGNAIATAVNWVFNLIVSFTFLTMTENITKHGTFWLFAGICFLGMVFTLIFVPETKNKSLEEVEELFMSAPERKNRQRQREIKNSVIIEEKPVRNVTNTRL